MELRFKVDYQCGDCGIKQWKRDWATKIKALKEADKSVTRAMTAIATTLPSIHDPTAIQARWDEIKSRDHVRDLLGKEREEKLKILAKDLPTRQPGRTIKRKRPFMKIRGGRASPLRNEVIYTQKESSTKRRGDPPWKKNHGRKLR
ncbi:MAG: hypothetical protein M1812_003432 [Candelaria pacifica]|nr:MAG: hypothetical protein M1812_003432 [Candelaria pacifica]